MSQVKAKVALIFRVYKDGELVRTEQLIQDIIKVGKLPSSHLRIDDENVSRMHAVIEVTSPDEIYIIDLGSASGTVVNGKKVNKAKLQSGDEIVLGDTRVIVELGSVGGVLDDEPTKVSFSPPDLPSLSPSPSPSPSTSPRSPAASTSPPPPPSPPAAIAAPVTATLGGAGASAPAIPGYGGSIGDNPFAAPPAVGANPFASPAAAPAGSEAENADNFEYGIVASGPPVPSDEVETADPAIEVVIMWGDKSILDVTHLSPPRSFYVGESSAGGANVDYLIGTEVLGVDRLPIVTEAGGGVAVVFPQGATGEVTVGNQTMSLTDLQLAGRLQPASELAGATQFPLPAGSTARVQYRGFTFLVRPVQAGKVVGGGYSVDWRPFLFVAGSLLVHAMFLLLFYFLPPHAGSLSLDLLNADSRLVQYLMEPPETEEEETPEWLNANADDQSGGKGKRHKDEEGQMGKKEARKTTNKFGIEGPEDNPDPHMAREEAREQARTAGILGVLRQSTGAWNSPTSPYGRDTALGNDPMSALGALMGDQIGENFGFGGLGLRGTGRGGGGTGEGTIGLGNLGTIGHGGGGGEGSGYGRGAGGLGGRTARVPQIRQGTADVRGSLSKEVIKRVIRRHINEVRFCYEQELTGIPDLEGRVTVAFIISPTGAVQSSNVANSTIANQRVETCIATAVRRWTFPQPDGGGIVIVNYPFLLQQTGG